MALLKLQDIGKIYVSEGNVAVGIRGVNLSFDKGEFVAVTGKSGSGKSTLLNVISGMDTYEEGEMYVDGNVTSHYLQPDWEQYRQEYISFIFQDYNIIESFTVLQNVELALMNIEDARERRARALELLSRVGMSDRIHQKGSKLSGGQKQRTVIARALAKDSPIILADEPTGNLDSKTSEEIISLLREVSKDKLLIIVTHNFEQVEHYATRHIRIFDGAVESDTAISQPKSEEPEAKADKAESTVTEKKPAKSARFSDLKKGYALGRTIFTSKPKFTIFLCVLLIIAMLAIYTITSLCGENITLFNKYYMFNHMDGRVVVTTRDGVPLSEDEVKSIAEEYGAESYIPFDALLDQTYYSRSISLWDKGFEGYISNPRYIFGKEYGANILGRYPEADNEIFLYLPISLLPAFGDKVILISRIEVLGINFKVVGVKYFYDNTKDPEILFTETAFKTLSYVYLLDPEHNYSASRFKPQLELSIYNEDKLLTLFSLYAFKTAFDIEEGKIYIYDKTYDMFMSQFNQPGDTKTSLYVQLGENVQDGNVIHREIYFEKTYTNEYFTKTAPVISRNTNYSTAIVHPSVLEEVAKAVLSKTYSQFSLFFGNDRLAHAAEAKLRDAGYVAASSDTEYDPDLGEILSDVMLSYVMLIIWFACVVFIALFMYICTMRMLNAFKNDTAIMRSMGIPVKIIRSAMYIRMLIALIPSLIALAAMACTVYLIPVTNGMFIFLRWWQYGMIILGMLFTAMFVTRRQIRRIFRTSVKKSLRGEH